MSAFDALDSAMSAVMSNAFAEPAIHKPRVSAQYAERAADPNRPQHLIRGVFSAGPADDRLKGTARGSEFSGTTRVVSASAELWIDRAEVAALSALPAKGDTIPLTSRAGSPVYAVSSVQHTDMGDLNLILVREDDVP